MDARETCALDSMEVDTRGIDAQLAIVLSYDGQPFCGFARQPGKPTVQGQVEEALSRALRRPVLVTCAGRTDAGVHARGQVVSFPIRREELAERNLSKLKRSLQALTDEAIAVQTFSVMPPEFSARFSAIEREYRYFIMPGSRKPLFMRHWCWNVSYDLDADAMNLAAKHLLGEHDFKSFCLAASAEGKSTVRTLKSLEVLPLEVMGEKVLCIRVVGNAFLHSMVRCIVGTLVAVGSGRRKPDWVQDVLAAKNRRAAGENAPACGLVFWDVRYREGVPSFASDAIGEDPRAYRLPPTEAPEEPARPDVFESPIDLSEHDVALAQKLLGMLEEADDEEASSHRNEGTSAQRLTDAELNANVPDAIIAAANAPGPKGEMRRNEVSGPAIPAAPRTRRIAPADPQPAEGEVLFSYEVKRDSAATRAAKRQKEKRKGLFGSLFGRSDDEES